MIIKFTAIFYRLHKKPDLEGPYWAREFALGHKDIDDDRPGASQPSPSTGRYNEKK